MIAPVRTAAILAYGGTLILFGVGVACGNDPAAPEAASATVSAARLASGGDQAFASFSHTCAIAAGGVQCWGANESGQLGDGLVSKHTPVPVRVKGLAGPIEAVAAGGGHSCALEAGGALVCWGLNSRRQLGLEEPPVVPRPTAVSGLPSPVTAVAAGLDHTCAIAAGKPWCWGVGTHGQLGSVATDRCGGYQTVEVCSASPLEVDGIANASALALGDFHSCALASGDIYCWGLNLRGQLGGAKETSRAKPQRVSGLPGPADAIAAGGNHSCALVAGAVWCWGANNHGQLGDGTRTDRHSPVAVRGLDAGVSAIAVGANHGCAASAAGVQCWGSNEDGQLGAAIANPAVPVNVTGISGEITALSVGRDQGCAALADGHVVCWGDGDFGQRGNGRLGPATPGATPVAPWDEGRLRDRQGDGHMVISCVGDSNTQIRFPYSWTWCERLEELLDDPRWTTRNRGWSGATAAAGESLRRGDDIVEYTVQFDEADVMILALGTNDCLQGISPEDALLAILHHAIRAHDFGIESFVALLPPAPARSKEINERIETLNDLIRKVIPAERIVDFYTGLGPEDFQDGVHVTDVGHEKRARAALQAIQATR